MTKLKRSDFRPVSEWIDNLPPERLERVMRGAAAIIEAVHLAEVRKALTVTQADLAKRTGLKQGEVSRIENATSTIQLKTLERYVTGLGGSVRIVADFPDGVRAEIPIKAGKPVKAKAAVSSRKTG